MKQLIVNHELLQTRIAILENNIIQEYYIETGGAEHIVGSIYKGRITNIEPSLQAAFIDIGLPKNAFLHYWDMIPATKDTLESDNDDGDEEEEDTYENWLANETPQEEPVENPGKIYKIFERVAGIFGKNNKPIETPKRKSPPVKHSSSHRRESKPFVELSEIPKRFPVNSSVIVQVTKGSIGTKGPRVTTNLSIPGRYVVLLPNCQYIGVSKRIEDRKERTRLRDILRQLNLPKGLGVICRTASTGLSERALLSDIKDVVEKWHKSQQVVKQGKAPVIVYQEPGILEKTIRDSLTEDIDEIIVDSTEAYDLTCGYVKRLEKKDQTRVRMYHDPTPIFNHFRVKEQIEKINSRIVTLSSGAELCIDETEALIAIDVNSKKSRGGKDHPETILKTNLEAAEQIGRQLRLRNVGGLVVIDFIDMKSRNDRNEVYRKMREVLAKDRSKSKILQISNLGLMEMTRQREYESLLDSTYVNCHYCHGRGLVKSSVTISVELQRRVGEILRKVKGKVPLKITVHPTVFNRLKNEDAHLLERMEIKLGGEFSFRSDPNLHHEEFKVFNADTGEEL